MRYIQESVGPDKTAHTPFIFKNETISIKDGIEKGFNDFQFFSRVAIPEIILYDWPAIYITIWILLVKAIREKNKDAARRVIRFALGLPRGFAKTTFIKVLICWLIVYDFVGFVLIVCSKEPLAENLLADISDILSSPNMVKLYGNWKDNLAIDNAQLKKASYRRRTVILAAIGAHSSVRGLNIVHERPDFILCDDMQTKENAQSDTESNHLTEWFVGTLLKCVDPFFAVVAYIGNMYPQNCILLKLKENRFWTSLITGCILADGKSLWEELRPIEALYEEYKHDEALGLAHIWFAEMMNDPILERISLLPKGSIPSCPFTREQIVGDAGFIIIDPAGFKDASDDNVIAAYLIMEGKSYAVGLVAGNLNPKQVITEAILLANINNIRIIFVEASAYQSTLAFWFNEILKELHLLEHFTIVEITPSNKSKDSRIRLFIKQLLSNVIFIADQETKQKAIFQALQYKIGKKKNKDDILDALAYETEVRAKFWPFIYSIPLNEPEGYKGQLVGAALPF